MYEKIVQKYDFLLVSHKKLCTKKSYKIRKFLVSEQQEEEEEEQQQQQEKAVPRSVLLTDKNRIVLCLVQIR